MGELVDTLLSEHLLSAITFLPLATVLALALCEGMFRLPGSVWKYTALVSSLVGLTLTIQPACFQPTPLCIDLAPALMITIR